METFVSTVKPAINGGSFDPPPAKMPVSSPQPAPVVPRRYLDPHSIRHAKLSKTALAIAGAEVMDGRLHLLNPTLEMIARAVGVSASYVAAARKLAPEQRQEVLRGMRPLVPPKPPAPVLSAEQRFATAVAAVGGVATPLDQLAAIERSGNGHG